MSEQLSDVELTDYIVGALSANVPCPSDLPTYVGLFVKLAAGESQCDPELKYLMAMRSTVFHLMGCKVWEVDTRQSRSQADSHSHQTQRQDGWSQAQSTGQSTSFRDAVGQSRYNDFNDAAMDAASSRNAQSQSHDESGACMQDIGHGGAMSEGEANRQFVNESVRGNQERMNNSIRGTGDRSGCHYTFSGSKTEGQGGGANFLINAAGSSTGTRTAWTEYRSGHSKNHTGVRRQQFAEAQRNTLDYRNDANERQNSSYFNSHIDDGSNSSTAAHSEDHANGHRDSSSHAEGLGQSANETKAGSENSNQGTSQSHSDGEQHRERNGSGFSVMDSQKLHQRFEHLKRLYSQLTEQIEFRKMQLRRTVGANYGTFSPKSCVPPLPSPCRVGSC